MHLRWGLKQVSVKGIANRLETKNTATGNYKYFQNDPVTSTIVQHFMEMLYSHIKGKFCFSSPIWKLFLQTFICHNFISLENQNNKRLICCLSKIAMIASVSSYIHYPQKNSKICAIEIFCLKKLGDSIYTTFIFMTIQKKESIKSKYVSLQSLTNIEVIR